MAKLHRVANQYIIFWVPHWLRYTHLCRRRSRKNSTGIFYSSHPIITPKFGHARFRFKGITQLVNILGMSEAIMDEWTATYSTILGVAFLFFFTRSTISIPFFRKQKELWPFSYPLVNMSTCMTAVYFIMTEDLEPSRNNRNCRPPKQTLVRIYISRNKFTDIRPGT